MVSARDETENQLIDIEKVLYSKSPALKQAIPGFVVNYLKKIVHQDELNDFLFTYGNLRDAGLAGAWLDYLNIGYTAEGISNLPASGRFIFVSNHPLGGLDGIVFIFELSKYYPDIKFPVNDILTVIRNMSGIFLPINKHGLQGKEAVRKIEEAFASDSQMLYFPAGLCSRKKRGVICDLSWQKSFITKAIQYKRDVIPAFFSGRNSDFFYNLSRFRNFLGIKANIEMLYLADEMFRQRDKKIRLVFGEPIPWQTFDKSKHASQWAEWVKSKSYALESSASV